LIYENDKIKIMPFSSIIEESLLIDNKNWFDSFSITNFTSHSVFPKSIKEMEQYKEIAINNKSNIVWRIFAKEKSNICKFDPHNHSSNIETSGEINGLIYIGNCSLQQIDLVNRSAEVALIIGEKEYHGKGIATQCFKWMIEHGFNRLGLHRIYAGTAEYNKGMLNVCVKSGMILERIAREALFINGQFQNCIYYSILRGDWNELQKEESG